MNVSYSSSRLSHIFQASLHGLEASQGFSSFSIDSGTVKPGDLFFCIKGERTDGHHYIFQALEQGAGAIILSQDYAAQHSVNFPAIIVTSPNQALLDLAAVYRSLFPGMVWGITGSNGKTSTKELASQILTHLGYEVHATSGNYNNHIGVPLTILSASLEEDFWVVEMGTNHFGDIAELTEVVRPHASIITSVGESHLEFLESTHGVAREKASIMDGMSPQSTVVIPETILHKEVFQSKASEHQLDLKEFLLDEVSLKLTPELSYFQWHGESWQCPITQPLMLSNLMGVLTLCFEQGIPVETLKAAVAALHHPSSGRIQTLHFGKLVIIDDTYNANPSSFKAVVRGLRQQYSEQRMLVVAGKMAELGDHSVASHHEVGSFLAKHAQWLFVLDERNGDAVAYCEGWQTVQPSQSMLAHELESLMASITEQQKPNDIILVKGSRSAHMERVVASLVEQHSKESC